IGGRNQQPRGAKLYPASASSLAISEGCLAWAEGVILRFISHSLLLGILSLLLFSRCDKKSDVKKSQGGGRMKLRKHFRCLALLVLCLGCAQFALAQGTDLGTIRGLVTDSSGAVIPNAKVTILDLGTNTTRETATNARGEYQMFGLRSGNYKVSISAPGLTTQDITGVVLNGSDVVSANATLRVAGTQEAIAVTAEAPTINTEDQTFSAAYAGIANIRVTTKRGGAGYHGSLFYNNKNSALAAWTVQDKIGQFNFAPTPFQSKFPNPFFNITDLGASIGGPIPKLGKTWFFAAYERDWTVSPVNVKSNTLPHPMLWSGDFSQIDPASQPVVPDAIF